MKFKNNAVLFLTTLFLFLLFQFDTFVHAWPIPDTGQTKCYDDTGEIPCPHPGEPFYGQDGCYTINPMSYTKLDAAGNDLPDNATSWVMVRDNVTRLIWESKQNMDGMKNYANPHDADNTYTWYDSNPSSNGNWPGTPGEGTDTEDFINVLNSSDYGGHHDWRLPTIRELGLIVDYSFYSGHINTTYFPNTAGAESSCYWSSTTYYDYQAAWFVNFNSAFDSMYDSRKDHSYYVRAVRGGQSAPLNHLVNNGDGTVTDTDTGLIWQQDTLYLNEGGVVWEEALSTCENSNLAGHSDWRLPSIKELRTLVDYSRVSPAINTTYFTHMPNKLPELSFWSSTKCNEHTYDCDTYQIMFLQGGTTSVSGHAYVRAVRGGQSVSLGHLVISSPKQASSWNINDTMPIRWNTAGLGTNVKISLSRQGGLDGSFVTIIATTQNDGQYDWTVTGSVSVNCVIKIEQADNPANWSTEGLFAINDQSNSNDDDGDGFTINQGDCNDNDNTVYPGAIEICGDGIDQDCNGSDLACTPDPDDIDDDGDSYTENQGDCNDNNNKIYPGAIEICGDGIDQNCNGSDLSCSNTPAAPTGITASDGTLSGKVQVSWNPSTGAESYDVYRADIPAWAGGVPKRIATSVTGTSYDDTSTISGKQYYYWVKSKNANGGSGYSMFNPGYWGANGYVPSLPANVAASDGTVSGKVTVTWAAVSNTVVYEIYRADYPAYLGGNIRNIGTSTTTSYNDATVVNGNQYYYWVKARNSWGVSGYSKFDTGYIGTDSPLPAAPTGVAATDGSSGKVTLTWNAVSGALIYEVYRAAKPANEGGVPTLLGTVKSPAVSFNDNTPICGQTYYYWVKSRNSWGSSGYSKFDTGFCTGP